MIKLYAVKKTCVAVPCHILNLNVLFFLIYLFSLNWLQIKTEFNVVSTEQLG